MAKEINDTKSTETCNHAGRATNNENQEQEDSNNATNTENQKQENNDKDGFLLNIVAPYYHLLGTIHGIRMALNTKKYYIATVISSGFAFIIALFSTLEDFFGFNKNEISIYVLIAIAIGIVIFSILKGFYDYNKTAHTHTAIRDEYYKNKILEELKLSNRMNTSGYRIEEFNNGCFIEKYVMSHKANQYLHTNSNNIKLLKLKNGYKPIKEIKDYIPFAISAILKNNKVAFNGPIVRQMQEIYPGMTSLYLQPTKYFDGQCTNELTYARLNDTTTIKQEFEGKQLLCNDDNVMYEMDNSPCSNYIGISTLVLTTDNYLIIPSQGKLSNANAGRLAPSGSGSAGKTDFKKANTLNDILTIAMEREFREECNINKKFEISTEIIGYARLLERGGKPDFFGVSVIKSSINDLGIIDRDKFEKIDVDTKKLSINEKKSCIRIFENGLTSEHMILLKIDNCVKKSDSNKEKSNNNEFTVDYNLLSDKLDELIEFYLKISKTPKVSIQLHIMKEITKNLNQA